MALFPSVSTYARAKIPDTQEQDRMWKSWVFALITVILALGSGFFLASFFVDLYFSAALPRLALLLAGGAVSLLWLSFTALAFILIRARWLKFILLALLPVLLWLPLYLSQPERPSITVLAVSITFVGMGIGWIRHSMGARASLASRPFSESAQIIRWILIALALAIALLFLPGSATAAASAPPRFFSLLTSTLESGFRSFGLPISRRSTLDAAIESFLGTFDSAFRVAPQTVRQALIRSQRELVTKTIFSQESGFTGQETVEELLWQFVSRSGVVGWAVPVIVFFILLAPAVLIRWVAAALSWVLLEFMLTIGFVRIGKELVEREVIVLA